MILRAGRLAAALEGVALRPVRLDGEELLRRVALVVRDDAWGTLPLEVGSVEPADDGAGVRLAGRARRGAVDFAWSVDYALAETGRVIAEAELVAQADFAFNRAGLTVLLPPAQAVGAVAGVWGTEHELRAAIAPQRMVGDLPQPLLGPFAAIDLKLASGVVLAGRFSGEVFELEDERNWTDGSFKLYAMALGEGLPRRIAAGDVLRQRLELDLELPPPRPGAEARRDRVVLGAPRGHVPGLGVRLDAGVSPPDPAVVAPLGLAHLRLAAGADGPAPAQLRFAREVGCEVELSLTLPAEVDGDALAATLAAARPARVLVHGEGAACTPPGAVETVRRALARAGLEEIEVAAGTDGHFADLNRDRPDPQGWDALVISMSPQVHGRDDATIVAALDGVGAVLASAQALFGPRAVRVSPLALTPRSGPGSAPGDSTDAEARARIAGPLAAAWTLALVGAIGAEVASITAFALSGPDGVLGQGGAPLGVARVLQALAARSGHELLGVEGLDVAAFATRVPEGGPTVWLANLAGDVREVALSGEPVWELGPHERAVASFLLGPWACLALDLPRTGARS